MLLPRSGRTPNFGVHKCCGIQALQTWEPHNTLARSHLQLRSLNLPVRGLSWFANVWCSLSHISTSTLRLIVQCLWGHAMFLGRRGHEGGVL